jgi:hypothetical protein
MARNDVSDATAPARAKEVRRTASGEDVPVSGQAAPFAAPPATSGAQGGLTAAKPQAASPMSLQSSKSALAPSASKDGDGSTRLCGRVVDARQRPVAGATVALADRGLVTNTGADGRFCFDAAAGLHELSVMAVGYEATRLQVRIEGESSEAMVTLRSVSVLDQPTANGPSGRAFWGDLAKPGGPTDSFQEVATGLTARAESLQSVAAFQQAAEAWSKVVSESRDPARLEARYRLAETRFKTWQLDRTKARARAALQAIDAFLGAAPAGLRKDQASQWRREIHY